MSVLSKSEFLFQAVSKNQNLNNGEEWALSTGVEIPAGAVQCFSDYAGKIGLIIPTSQEEFDTFVDDRKSKAIHLTRRKVVNNRIDTDFQARLILRDLNQRSIFYFFVDELLGFLDGKENASITDVSAFLAKWRHFFSSDKQFVIDPQIEVGLLCEMEVLLGLLRDEVPNAVESWYGPEKTRHDFLLNNCAIECKGTASADRMLVSIHGRNQLETPNNKPLYLVFRRYNRHPDGALSIPSLVEELQTYSAFNIESFTEKMHLLGIDIFDEAHSKAFNNYFAVDVHEFEITEEFPRVEVKDPANRISDLQYKIDLAGPRSIPGYRPIPSFIK